MGKARQRKLNRVGPKKRRPPQLSVLKEQARKKMGRNFLETLMGMGVPEIDPRFNRKEKISPEEFFISVGPGEIEDKYYACIMTPERDGHYTVVAKMKAGYDTAEEAKAVAGQMLPSLPILVGADSEYFDSYEYPYYKEQEENSDGTETVE